MPVPPSKTRLRLRAADSFDLIRLLARSQHDPRKALCELVQNSLDAQATRVDLTWFTHKGARAVRILDDGHGVFPELSREEALRRVATTIGHSHKRGLTPAQRRELMALGKFGIGLLGFWAVGHVMRIRSRVGGGPASCLELVEDSPEARLERVRRHRLDEPSTFTEVTVSGVHQSVLRQIRPGRLHAYLARELRGQLLDRRVEIRIHDRVARGRAVKEFLVKAEPFLGRHLAELSELQISGHEDARVELYLVPVEEDRVGRVTLSCGGTTVLEDLADVDGTGEPRSPWDGGRFEGVIDFPELDVAPGTRRHFRRDAAAGAFIAALGSLEERLRALLEEDEERRREERDRNLARKIRRVFRRLTRRLPEYDLFDLRGRQAGTEPGTPEGASLRAEDEATVEQEVETAEEEAGLLFEAGPLAAVQITPARSRLPLGAVRGLRARPLDADGRRATGPVAYLWRLDGPGSLTPQGSRASYAAPQLQARATVTVIATQDATRCEAQAEVTVTEELNDADKDHGIPEPVPVHAPSEPWRSRLRQGAWEYNTGHRDYETAQERGNARRLRYLVHLFAKEVVLRNFGGPSDGPLLERMVEILTHLDETRISG